MVELDGFGQSKGDLDSAATVDGGRSKRFDDRNHEFRLSGTA